jgi:isopropylmalate/homocitrate/citramalate synthase
VHCHNDFGLAVANTLAGALAGAEFLSTTVTGIGERSGNAALEEVVMALKVLYGIDVGLNTERLCIVAAEVTRRSGVTLQPHKAIIGKNAFAHETGTVVAGLLHDHFTAETYDPSLVGQSRTIVVGKKSGRAAIEFKLREMGIPMADAGVSQTLIEVKARATSLGRALTDAEFEKVVHGVEAHVRSTAGSVDR